MASKQGGFGCQGYACMRPVMYTVNIVSGNYQPLGRSGKAWMASEVRKELKRMKREQRSTFSLYNKLRLNHRIIKASFKSGFSEAFPDVPHSDGLYRGRIHSTHTVTGALHHWRSFYLNFPTWLLDSLKGRVFCLLHVWFLGSSTQQVVSFPLTCEFIPQLQEDSGVQVRRKQKSRRDPISRTPKCPHTSGVPRSS